MIEGPTPLRVLIIGSGAIGTYLGGTLAHHGHRVTFLERPRRVDTTRNQGVTIQLEEKTLHVPSPRVVGSLEHAFRDEPYTLALFALKSYHTADMASRLEGHGDHVPPILCLQNGVGNEEILAQALSANKVLPGTVTTSVVRHAPGQVSVRKRRGVGLTAHHPLSGRLEAAFQRAGLDPQLYQDPQSMKWTKLVTNLMGNASCAILDMTPGEVYTHPELYRMELRQLREALSVMAAQGLHPVSLPGLPSRVLSWGISHLPALLTQPILARLIKGGRGGKMPSFHIDLHSGKAACEVEVLNGAVARVGEELGVPTPVNATLNRTLLKLVKGDLPLETFARQPARLLSTVHQA